MRSHIRDGRGRRRGLALAVAAVAIVTAGSRTSAGEEGAAPQRVAVVGDAIPGTLTGRAGDPSAGRAIVLDRRVGNCLICHKAPVDNEPFQGDLGPDLAGVASRWTVGQIRLRMVDPKRVNAATLMPAYHRTTGLARVAVRFAGRPVLTAQEIEDVVAWLATLK